MSRVVLVAKLAAALDLNIPYSGRPELAANRLAAVLVLFGFDAHEKGLSLLLTRRTETVATHRGQIAFPGGLRELIGGEIEEPTRAAIREAGEELGIPEQEVQVLGHLPSLNTVVSGFSITPVLGVLNSAIEKITLHPNAGEIAEAFWVPLEQFLNTLNTQVYRCENLKAGDFEYAIHSYQIGPRRVWGATAAIIKNLLDRLDALG